MRDSHSTPQRPRALAERARRRLAFAALCLLPVGLLAAPAYGEEKGQAEVEGKDSRAAEARATARPQPPVASVAADGPFGTPHPDAPEELEQFAFLVGRWSCEVDSLVPPDWTRRAQSQAEFTGYYMQDGYAIMDDFRGGFGEGYLASTFRAFDRRAGEWRIHWLDGRTGVWSSQMRGYATPEGGMRIESSMTTAGPDGAPIEVQLQYEFYDIERERFRWRQNASTDGGETWRRETTRMECARTAG
ncbi:MAG: hypothetical protein AAF725_10600 [Acidobacteriota bacterium]